MARSCKFRDVFGEVFFVSGRVRRGRFSAGRVRRCRVIVGTCSAKSGYSRDVFGDVGVVLERVRRSRHIVCSCSAMSV